MTTDVLTEAELNELDVWLYLQNTMQADHRNLIAKAFAAARRSLWRPIETAPKDGTRLLVHCAEWGRIIAYHDGEDEDVWQLSMTRIPLPSEPVSWQHLPPPPTDTERGSDADVSMGRACRNDADKSPLASQTNVVPPVAAPTQRDEKLKRTPAWFTYDPEADAYYFAPSERTASPYREQREVRAILDIASDGTLAGVELVWGDLPPPPSEGGEKILWDISGAFPTPDYGEDVAGVIELLRRSMRYVQELAHADYAEPDQSTGEAFDYHGRQLIDAVCDMDAAASLLEKLAGDRQACLEFSRSQTEQINLAEAALAKKDELIAHMRLDEEKTIAALTAAKAECEREHALNRPLVSDNVRLRAECERLRGALEKIAHPPHYIDAPHYPVSIARAALGSERK